jgi:hypothetical protein
MKMTLTRLFVEMGYFAVPARSSVAFLFFSLHRSCCFALSLAPGLGAWQAYRYAAYPNEANRYEAQQHQGSGLALLLWCSRRSVDFESVWHWQPGFAPLLRLCSDHGMAEPADPPHSGEALGLWLTSKPAQQPVLTDPLKKQSPQGAPCSNGPR